MNAIVLTDCFAANNHINIYYHKYCINSNMLLLRTISLTTNLENIYSKNPIITCLENVTKL